MSVKDFKNKGSIQMETNAFGCLDFVLEAGKRGKTQK